MAVIQTAGPLPSGRTGYLRRDSQPRIGIRRLVGSYGWFSPEAGPGGDFVNRGRPSGCFGDYFLAACLLRAAQ